MNLHFRGTLTKDEYVDIITLLSSPLKNAQPGAKAKWIPSILLLIIAVIVGAGTIWYGVSKGDSVIMLTALGPILMVFLILASLRGRKRISPAAQAEAMWRNEANRRLVIEGTITDEGIAMKTAAGESLIRWEGFAGYGEYKDIVVLIQQVKTSLSISKRFFEKEEDWTAFRDIASARLSVTHRVEEPSGVQPAE